MAAEAPPGPQPGEAALNWLYRPSRVAASVLSDYGCTRTCYGNQTSNWLETGWLRLEASEPYVVSLSDWATTTLCTRCSVKSVTKFVALLHLCSGDLLLVLRFDSCLCSSCRHAS